MEEFKSQPNRCDGCPLGDVPVGFKVLNQCAKYRPGYEVRYTVDDLGRQVCLVHKVKESIQ